MTELRRLTTCVKHSSSGYGAIAQLGERVLCKHEVVGSIPSGSTSLCWLKPATARQAGSEGCQAVALAQAGHRWLDNISSAKTSFRVSSSSPDGEARDF